MRKSGLINCYIVGREGSTESLFWVEDGASGFWLEGYAIVPLEHYKRNTRGALRVLEHNNKRAT